MKTLDIESSSHKLSNGLEVVLHKDSSVPVVAVNIWYKVGAANDKVGKTGYAHLFEHLMFQGSQNIPKEAHFRYIQEAGGSANGSTSRDRTNYYESLPSNQLELALWLESDRMGFLLEALSEEKLENQKSVVINERLEHYDNQPYGLVGEKLNSLLFPFGHPHHFPVIGYLDDIKKFSLEDAKRYFKNYYSPTNAILTVAGDIDYDNALNLIQNYFGDINNEMGIAEENFASLPKLEDYKYLEHFDKVNVPQIYFGWRTNKLFHEDEVDLHTLAFILSGNKNSLLTKKLVYDTQLCQRVSAQNDLSKYDGSFLISATPKNINDIEQIKKNIFEIIENLISSNGTLDKEIATAVNNFKFQFVHSIEKISTRADLLSSYKYYVDEPNWFLQDYERFNKVTTESVKRIAKKYLNKNFVELRVLPKNDK
ncbi:MAG: insulinase family protein [Melioribacteraceae bacterium]|nr:insulinase family protein [Melioribacteraceae bacterium]